MVNPNELYHKEMKELMTEINNKTQTWLIKLKEQSKHTKVEM